MFKTILVCHSCFKVKKKDTWVFVSVEEMRGIHDIAQLHDERIPVDFTYCPDCEKELS